MSILVDIIPSRFRRVLYALYALAGLLLGSLAVAGIDVGTATAVFAFIGTALGITAYGNVTPGDSHPGKVE